MAANGLKARQEGALERRKANLAKYESKVREISEKKPVDWEQHLKHLVEKIKQCQKEIEILKTKLA